MSDLIEREKACKQVCQRCRDGWPVETDAAGAFHRHEGMTWSCYASALRALPAAVPPAELLALDVCRDLAALLRSEPFPAADARWAMLQRRAEEAYRASAQPEPRPLTIPLTDEARRIMACPRCGVSAQPEPAAPVPGIVFAPTPEPFRFAFDDEEEPAAPAPCVCGRCPGLEEPDDAEAEDIHRALVEMRPKPAPCGTCGGSGWLWRSEHPTYRDLPMEQGHDDTRYACPDCRGGA